MRVSPKTKPTQTKAAESQTEFLTVRQGADWLQCSERHLKRLIRSGEVPSARLGRKRLLLRSSVLKWWKEREESEQRYARRRGRR